MNVLVRVEPDLCRHHQHERVAERSHGLHADGLALEIVNSVNGFVCEQFEAADMYPRQQGNRVAGSICLRKFAAYA